MALGDTLLYMLDSRGKQLKSRGVVYTKEFESVAAYRVFFNEIIHLTKWIPSGLGVSCVILAIWFNYLAIRFRINSRAFWGISKGKMTARIERMLDEDIPVILCIPFVINPLRRKKLKARLYEVGNRKRYQTVNAHFVVITGIRSYQDGDYYVVSSWGRQLEMKISEYRQLQRSQLLGGFLGNVLVIQ